MTRLISVLLGVLAAPFAVLGPAPALASEGPWQAEAAIKFQWQLSPPPGEPAVGAYRLYDPKGDLVRAETRSLAMLLDPIPLSPVPIPGIYTLEAWLQNEAGGQGPRSTTTVRFDNAIPPLPALQPPAGWVRGADSAVLKIGPAPTPLPLSGLRGYALSVDRGEGSSPCAGATRCAAGEIDLAGSGGGSISLGTLPEGISFVRAVAVSGSGVASPVATGELRVDATPPLLSLHGAPSGWSDGPVKVTVSAKDALSGMAASGPLGPFTAIAVDGAPASSSPGDAVTVWVTGSGVHRLDYFARDAAGNVTDGRAGAAGPATASVRIDEDPPAVVFSPAQDPAEPERIEATVSDPLSGSSPDRGWISVRPAGTAGRYSQLPTHVAGGKLIARWDSDSYPPGKYEFRSVESGKTLLEKQIEVKSGDTVQLMLK